MITVMVKQKPLVVINGEAMRERQLVVTCEAANQPVIGRICNQWWMQVASHAINSNGAIYSAIWECVSLLIQYSMLHSFIHVAAPVIHYSWWWWWWRWWWQSFPACTANLSISSQSASRLHHQPMMAMNDYEWIGSFNTKHIQYLLLVA